jgi:aspartate/methionine/tyrosine aminotransferase
MKIAQRLTDISPFFVMEILARARELEQQGRDIIHMEIGEPDFPTPPKILEAAARALAEADIKYTPAAGLPELRKAIAGFYEHTQGVSLDHRQIFVTPGASGALMLAMGLALNPGEGVLLADPSYPCYPNFVRLFGGFSRSLPVDEASEFNLSAHMLKSHWAAPDAGVILASPANPTGSVMGAEAMQALVEFVDARQGFIVSDEIYHGLEYGSPSPTALHYSDQVFVINSFSKYFGMTGWRLGWAVVPEAAVDGAERLAQNLYISAPTLSQLAALAAFDPENIEELERRRRQFAERRDVLCEGLSGLGFLIRARPEGAFYVYADCSRVAADSQAFALALLEEAGVAVTPGRDFGAYQPDRYLRFCYTASIPRLREGLARMAHYLRSNPQ